MELSKLMGCVKRPFIPSELFSGGLIDGAWFDPSDLSTLYQDAAGTIPVTAVEQPVGLMLDKSRGMMLGPDKPVYMGLLWTLNAGTYTKTTAGWSPLGFYGLGLKKTYFLTFRVKTLGAGQLIYLVRRNSAGTGNETVAQFNVVAGGIYTARVSIVTDGYTPAELWLDSDTFIGDIDNISIKELYGYHATQPITASRPTLSARKNILLATEALATQSVTTLAATYTLSFTGTGSVALSGAATGTLTGTGTDRVSLTFTPTAGTLTLTVSGSVTKAQVELGSVAGPYQSVNTATDYDADERYFKKYLRFDGVDDYLNLPYMGLYAGGACSIVAAMSENRVAYGTTLINETNSTIVAPMYNPTRQSDIGNNWRSLIRNDANVATLSSTGALINADGHISVRSRIERESNTAAFENSINKESYNYARAGTLTLDKTTIGALLLGGVMGSPNNMNLYGLIITKSALTDSQRVACERHQGRKAGVPL